MGKFSQDSPFVEGQLLLAASENDRDEVARLLENMLPGELNRLDRALDLISTEIDASLRQRDSADQQ